MGFFRRLFGRSKPNKKTKKTDTFTSASHQEWNLDANKHARAVAAATATAAVAEAALAAAHAAVEVVRLTNGVGGSARSNVSLPISIRRHRQLVAVKIQSAFRRYLARRALRALKALVKLQALVRGHIVRKQSADMLRRMQTLVRLQDRARATRSLMSESVHFSSKSSLSYNPLPESPDKIGYQKRVYSSKFDARSSLKRSDSNSKVRNTSSLDRRRLASSGWLDRWMEESLWNDSCDASSLRYMQAENEKVDKILEVDTWKPHLGSQRNKKPFQTAQHVMPLDNNSPILVTFDSPSKRAAKEQSFIPSQSSMDYYSSSSLKYPTGKDELATSMTSENSPQALSAPSRPGSASARRAHFSPTRSEYSWGFFSSYAEYPSYMSNTESFSAKVRSQSVPRQRPEFEKYSMSTKKSIQEFCEAGAFSELGLAQDDDFRSRTYLSSSHSNRIG